MKGYAEERGHAFKLAFDAVSKQFVANPIAHDFQPKAEANVIVQKLADVRKNIRLRKARGHVARQLNDMGPELREDVGMTEHYAASQNR